MEEKIPELNLKLTSIEVKPKVKKLGTLGDWYANTNLFGKIKYLWYWYWYVSETESWDGYLNRQFTWEPELVKDVTAYHNIDAEAELTRLLNENIRKEMGEEAYQVQQKDIATQIMDQTYPSWRELQSNSVKEEIDVEILKQLKEGKGENWKIDEK